MVGERERLGRVAPTRHQRQDGRGFAWDPGEVGGEAGQVRSRGAAPTVDRLHRVTHRGDGEPAIDRAAEQRRQQHPLRVPGVLVLVEQDEPEALPLRDAHFGVLLGESRSQRHLRTEIEHAATAHGLGQSVHERQQLDALLLDVEDVGERLRGAAPLARAGRQRVHEFVEFGVGLAQVGGFDQMLGELAGQREDGLGEGRGGAFGVEVAVPAGDHAVGQLPVLRRRQQRRGRFDRQQQAVFGEQASGIGVVGADLRVGGRDPFPQATTRVERAQQR